MFDSINVKYPLPAPRANGYDYQTKSLDCGMDQYELREDGSLWLEHFDREDQSESGKWEREHPGEELPERLKGLRGLMGCMARVNKHWLPFLYTGEIRFYDSLPDDGWIEWSAYFVEGRLKELHQVVPR